MIWLESAFHSPSIRSIHSGEIFVRFEAKTRIMIVFIVRVDDVKVV